MFASVLDTKYSKLFKDNEEDLLNSIASYKINYPIEDRTNHARGGSLKFTDAYVLKQLLYKHKPSTILEVGSFLGFSTRWLLEVSSAWDAKVTAIDPNIRHRIFDNPREFVESLNSQFYPERLEIVTGFFGEFSNEYAYYDYEQYEPKRDKEFVDVLLKEREVINENWDRKFDFIFIDGDHSYEATMTNFAIAIKLLNPGGCIAFHDTVSWDGVNQALKQLAKKYKNKARVRIYGNKKIAKLFNKIKRPIDGVGSFELLK